MNNQIIMFVICLPYEKSQKIEVKNKYVLMNDENIYIWYIPFYIGNIIYLARIVRALLSNKIVFCIFAKSQ